MIQVVEVKYRFILHSRYQCRWWPGDTRNQGTSSCDIDRFLIYNVTFALELLFLFLKPNAAALSQPINQ